GDRILVEVTRHGDAGPGRAELIELLAHVRGHKRQVAGVDAHAAAAGAGDADRGLDAAADVIGVDQPGGRGAERLDLRAERVFCAVVVELPGVRGGAHRGDAGAASGCRVARRAEAGDVRGARGGDGRFLGGAT